MKRISAPNAIPEYRQTFDNKIVEGIIGLIALIIHSISFLSIINIICYKSFICNKKMHFKSCFKSHI